jgi:hypothetical protein
MCEAWNLYILGANPKNKRIQKLLASHKYLKEFVISIAKYLYLKILPMLNIFLGTEDGAVNKIGRNLSSQGFLSYSGGDRQ